MSAWKGCALGAALALAAWPVTAQVDLAPYLKQDVYREIKISPTGEYYAATVPLEDRTILVVIRRSDKQPTARISGVKGSDIADFHWINDERVLVSSAERLTALEEPVATGELHAINADGTAGRTLMAHYDREVNKQTIKFGDFFAGFLVDDLPEDDRNVLISVHAFSSDPKTSIERMDAYTGRRITVATAPVRRASFTADNTGEVRFARGQGNDNVSKLYYRDARGSAWRLINDEAESHRFEMPLGFSADNTVAYLQVEQPSGPDAIVAMDIASGQRTPILRDDKVDPYRILYDSRGMVPVGASFMKDRLVNRFFDETSHDLVEKHQDNSKEARWMRTWSNEWMGERESLAGKSPTRMADRIKAPVFLAAGGQDDIAPIVHSQRMEKALKAAGTPVETLYFPTEGHGFYTQEHQREFYSRLLDFLGRHLGGAKAK